MKQQIKLTIGKHNVICMRKNNSNHMCKMDLKMDVTNQDLRKKTVQVPEKQSAQYSIAIKKKSKQQKHLEKEQEKEQKINYITI